jgi:hypothetical protein
MCGCKSSVTVTWFVNGQCIINCKISYEEVDLNSIWLLTVLEHESKFYWKLSNSRDKIKSRKVKEDFHSSGIINGGGMDLYLFE